MPAGETGKDEGAAAAPAPDGGAAPQPMPTNDAAAKTDSTAPVVNNEVVATTLGVAPVETKPAEGAKDEGAAAYPVQAANDGGTTTTDGGLAASTAATKGCSGETVTPCENLAEGQPTHTPGAQMTSMPPNSGRENEARQR